MKRFIEKVHQVDWFIFGPKINSFRLFTKSVLQVFLKLCLMEGINEWLKGIVLVFEGKFTLISKLDKWVILSPKITLMKFFSKFIKVKIRSSV